MGEITKKIFKMDLLRNSIIDREFLMNDHFESSPPQSMPRINMTKLSDSPRDSALVTNLIYAF